MRVAVVGDACVDVYQYCSVARLAPERPVPVVDVLESIETPGMAANVHRNLTAMGIESTLFCNRGWLQQRKTRIVDSRSNHMFVRIDQTSIDKSDCLLDVDMERVLDHDVVLIADYDKGYLSHETIAVLTEHHDRVFLDTKKRLDSWAVDAYNIKINETEYGISRAFIEDTLKSKVIQTRGAEGCRYRDQDFPVDPKTVLDVSGAGDTFHAGLVAAFTATGNVRESISYANQCASLVVQLPGMRLPDAFPEIP